MSMARSVHINSLDEDIKRFVPDEVFETEEEASATLAQPIASYEQADGPFVYPALLHSDNNIGYVQAMTAGEGWEVGYHIAKQQ